MIVSEGMKIRINGRKWTVTKSGANGFDLVGPRGANASATINPRDGYLYVLPTRGNAEPVVDMIAGW